MSHRSTQQYTARWSYFKITSTLLTTNKYVSLVVLLARIILLSGNHLQLSHKLNTFRNTLSSKLSEKGRHAKELEFMASNGVRQLGEPRIGIFSNRQRPDPFHHEANNWQHVLNLIINNQSDKFLLKVLSIP